MCTYPKFKKYLSLLLVFVLLLGFALPVAAEEPTPEQEQTAQLYAKVVGQDSFVQYLSTTENTPLQVTLYCGVFPELQEITDPSVLAFSGLQLQSAGDGTFTISYTDSESGSITYTPTGTGISVAFEKAEPDSGDDLPKTYALFAKWAGADGFAENLELPIGNSSPVKFFYGTSMQDCVEVPWGSALSVGGTATYTAIDSDATFGTRFYRIGVSGVGAASITYTDENGIAYTYSYTGIAAQDPDTPPASTLFARYANSQEYISELKLSAGATEELAFFYGNINDPTNATPIVDSAALGKDNGVTLQYSETSGCWTVGMEESYSWGQIHYQAADSAVSFSVSQESSNSDTGSNQRLYAMFVGAPEPTYTGGLRGTAPLEAEFLFFFGEQGQPDTSIAITDEGALEASYGLTLTHKDSGSWYVKLEDTFIEGEITYTYNGEVYSFVVSLITEPPEPQEPCLYATWPDGSDFLTKVDGIGPEGVDLRFYFRDSENNVTEITEDGILEIERLTVTRTGDCWNVKMAEGQSEGVLVYLYNDEPYFFNVTGGSQEPQIPDGPCLYAANMELTEFYTNLSGMGGNSKTVRFFFRDSENHSTELTGADQLVPEFFVSTTHNEDGSWTLQLRPGTQQATISYTHEGTTYTFIVASGEIQSPDEPEGPDLSQLPDGPCLYATYAGPNPTEVFTEVCAGVGLRLYFRDSENNITEITNPKVLMIDFGVILDYNGYLQADLLPGMSEGYISYAHNGQIYTFKLKGPTSSENSQQLAVKFANTNAVQYKLKNVNRNGDMVVFYRQDTDSGEWLSIPNDGSLTCTNLVMEYKGTVGQDENVWAVSFPRGVYIGTVTDAASGVSVELRMSGDMEHMDDVVGTIGGAANGGAPVENPGNHHVTVNYGREKITVGIGMFQQQTQTFVGAFGDEYNSKYTHRFGFEFILAALKDYGDTKETPASQDFLDCISDVRFYIPYWKNEDGSTDISNCMLSTSAERFDASGRNTWRTIMVADNGSGFDCTLAMDFTYTEPGKDPVTYTLHSEGFYHKTERMDIYADNPNGSAGAYLDTAEKLNKVLSSRENMKAWLTEYFPDQCDLFGSVDTMTLYLPAVTYDDIIVMNCPFGGDAWNTTISIYGADGGYQNPQTIMPGFIHKGGGHELRHIRFQGDPSKTVSYKGGNTFTCGVLMDGPADQYNDMIGIASCVFENLDYGTYSTETGFTGGGTDNVYRNCTYGMYIDCKGKENGAPNDEFTHIQFINCKVAVWIKSLPEYITPYMIRVVDNTFLNNQHDIKVTTPGRHYYYFYRNYYYGTYQEVTPISDLVEGRAAIVDTEGQGAVVNTGPSRRYQPYDSELWIFENTANILNNEAGNLKIDQDALINLEEEKEVAIIDNAASGEAVAVWTFGTEGGAAE